MGAVVLGGESKIKGRKNQDDINHKKVRKLRFYNQCLYHAMGIAEFVAIWDVDELWVPLIDHVIANWTQQQQHQLEGCTADMIADPYGQTMSLVEAIRLIVGGSDR